MLVSFGPQYLVGHAVMDSQHRQLFAILNELHAAMKERRAAAFMRKAFTDLERYIRFHFGTEERLMAEHDYPEVESHKAAHDAFVDRLLELHSDFERQHTTVPMEMMVFLRSWLHDHICASDKTLGRYLAERS